MSLAAITMTNPVAESVDADQANGPDVDLLDDGRMSGRRGPRRAQSCDESGQTRGRNRTCIVNRTVLPEDELIRFVVGPSGDVVPDLKCRLPGRGAWVRASRIDLLEAIRRKAFSRAFRGAGTVGADLPRQVEGILREAALGRLGLARKAGLVVTGFAKVDAAIRSGRAAMVLQASDAAENGVSKLAGAMRAAEGSGFPAIPIETGLPSGMLSMALGGEHVIHAALMQDSRSASAMAALERYRLFVASDGVSSDDSGNSARD
jgi:predicted RNA-binding protein YlxR (DUF448 family)